MPAGPFLRVGLALVLLSSALATAAPLAAAACIGGAELAGSGAIVVADTPVVKWRTPTVPITSQVLETDVIVTTTGKIGVLVDLRCVHDFYVVSFLRNAATKTNHFEVSGLDTDCADAGRRTLEFPVPDGAFTGAFLLEAFPCNGGSVRDSRGAQVVASRVG